MANLYFDLPAPVGDGVGAAVDTSEMGRTKTITVQGTYSGTLIVEASNEGAAGPWAQFILFKEEEGKKKIEIAARFMRVRRLGTNSIIAAAPNVDVAANDDGGMFADLPAGSPGGQVDVSTFGIFKTVIVQNLSIGSVVQIEVSEDGVDWAQCMTFANSGILSKEVGARFMRANLPLGGTANIDVGAINDPISMADFGPPITVRGPTNAEGVSPDAARADHDHRLEYEVEDEGILISARPRMNFVGDGVGAVDIPGQDKTEVTIPGPNLGDGGAVVKRSTYVATSVSTSSGSFVDAMSGNTVIAPIDGDYWVIFESEAENQSASGIIEIGISVNSVVAVVANSERESQGPAADTRPVVTTIQLPGLTAGDLIRALFRKKSGGGSVTLRRKHLSIFKVQ